MNRSRPIKRKLRCWKNRSKKTKSSKAINRRRRSRAAVAVRIRRKQFTMAARAQKQTAMQQAQFAAVSARDRQSSLTEDRTWPATLGLRSTVAKRACPASPGFIAGEPETNPYASGSARVSHNFGQIPIFSKSRTRIQAKLSIGQPNDTFEQDAEQVAAQVMLMPEAQALRTMLPVTRTDKLSASNGSQQEYIPEIVYDVLAGAGRPLDTQTRAFFEPRLGVDLSQVRVHEDPEAAGSAKAIAARAYTLGNHIVFGAGQHAPGTTEGRRLLAHELTHVVQQHGGEWQQAQTHALGTVLRGDAASKRHTKGIVAADRSAGTDENSEKVRLKLPYTQVTGRDVRHIQRQSTPGEQAVDYFWTQLDQQTALKVVVDKLKSAAKEIAQNTALEFHRLNTPPLVEQATSILNLGPVQKSALISEWQGYLNAPNTLTKVRQGAFFAKLMSPLQKIEDRYKRDEAVYRLRHTTPKIMDLIYTVAADASFPTDELWVYAAREGMVDYVRDFLGLTEHDFPSRAALAGVPVDQPVSGFAYFGLDDFYTDLRDTNLINYLPGPMNMGNISPAIEQNEKLRMVESATASDVLTALYAMVAMLKQRRAKFEADAVAYGYATPSRDELVYWTYIYYNIGPYGGKEQLEKYAGKRALGDWITRGEYPNAIKVLETYKASRDVFVGFSLTP
jgi:Domain of unknown function (DUF4157)